MAKPFRLTKVLEHRAQREREQMGVLAARDAATRAARSALTALQERKVDSEAAALESRRGALAVDAAAMSAQYAEALAAAIGAQTQVLRATEEEQHLAEVELLRRRQDRRALETLRDRYAARVAESEQRREAMLNDEVAMARSARRQVARASGG